MMKRLLTAAILTLLTAAVQAGGLYPLSNMQQLDANGKIMPGARLFLYDGGTTTPRVGYKDSSLTTPHPNPIVADSAGRIPLIYLDDGFFRHRLTTKTGTLIFDQDGIPVISSTSGGSGTSVDPDSVFKTRDIKIRFDDQPLAGYVRLNGRTIGSASSGATERANADTQSLFEELWGFSNISVSGGKGASAAADFAANKALTLPNAAGRGLFGMDNMGAGAQGVLTSAIVPGYTGGAETYTLQNNNLPVSIPWTGTYSGSGTTTNDGNHSHTFSGTTGGISALHNHTWSADYIEPTSRTASVNSGTNAPLSNIWTGSTTSTLSGTTSTESVDHTHAFSGTTSFPGAHSHGFTWGGSVSFGSNSGGGQAFSKLNPYMTFMIFIRL